MPELRDEEREFGQAVVAAAAALNVPELVVEKDYWITQILRALRTEYFGQFVMKGGHQSLEGVRAHTEVLGGRRHPPCSAGRRR